MLEAKKSVWFEKIFGVYNRNLLKRRFHSFRVSGVEILRQTTPQIIYVNHSSWWDGLIAFEISRAINADSYVMMEEKQLQKLFLFRHLGAFSVVRENPRQSVESIKYAVKLLRDEPRRTIWIFPQGEILPNETRPLRFYRGLARVIEKVGECSIVPCAIRLEFTGDFKPEIFVKIGETESFGESSAFDAKHLTAELENNLTALLDDLQREVASGATAVYKNIF